MPILNYGRLKNNVRVQDARLEEQIVNYQETVLEAAREVEDGLAGFIHKPYKRRELRREIRRILDGCEGESEASRRDPIESHRDEGRPTQ